MPFDGRLGARNHDETTSVTTVGALLLGRGARRALKPCLVVLVGANVGETFRLDGEMLLGRSPTCTVRLDDDGVSRRHARIWPLTSPGAAGATNVVWTIEDLGSANGTVVNGERIASHGLANNDQIQIGSTLLKFTYHDELEENFQRQMYDAALRDGLTNAFNKKYFLTRLDTELAYARRHQTHLSLVMLDVDHFKRVNDTYGHLTGDAVLVQLAQIVSREIRSEDVFARYGGEEFAVICRGVPRDQAYVMAERLRAVVETTLFEAGGKVLRASISLGVAGMPEFAAESSLQLVAAADEALYAAKKSGRNRVHRYG